jgi:hypothetical protein
MKYVTNYEAQKLEIKKGSSDTTRENVVQRR